LPGVLDYIRDAKKLHLKLAVASSSRREWVTEQLSCLEIFEQFDAVICAEDVRRVKPHPDLYRHALSLLGLEPHEAIVFEDSPNGITAARAAGIFCVVVPNPLTRQLPIDHADLRLTSLADMPLQSLISSLAESVVPVQHDV
ncbi:MAG: HAD-IA family hydrolase, partial [Chloroflexota bacterium]|nr:HAD-IA family hydrolase [Chloroflexota bacterium]